MKVIGNCGMGPVEMNLKGIDCKEAMDWVITNADDYDFAKLISETTGDERGLARMWEKDYVAPKTNLLFDYPDETELNKHELSFGMRTTVDHDVDAQVAALRANMTKDGSPKTPTTTTPQ